MIPVSPEAGSCQEKGLGWTGRNIESYPDGDKDQFFTKWTDLFRRPECVDRIEVHRSYPDIGEEEHYNHISPVQHFTQVNSAEWVPSNTVVNDY